MKQSLALILILILQVSTQNAVADAQKVKTTPIKHDFIEYKVRTFGILAPKVEEISFSIAGRIERFSVQEGERVSAGQTLAQLDTSDAKDTLSKAQNELDNARRLLERMRKLHESGTIQVSQLEDVKAEYERVEILFNSAKLALDRCFLKASSAGLILKQYIDSRTSITPGQPLFVFQSDTELWIMKVELTDKNALFMSSDAVAMVTFSPYPGEFFDGWVSKVAQVANPTDGLYTAEVTITPGERALRPGMIGEVDLIKKSEQAYSIVPFDSIVNLRVDKGRIYIVSADGSRAIATDVTINSIQGELVSVVEDLKDFGQVITHGHHSLHDQSDIEILE